jgi:hypothetical protein
LCRGRFLLVGPVELALERRDVREDRIMILLAVVDLVFVMDLGGVHLSGASACHVVFVDCRGE